MLVDNISESQIKDILIKEKKVLIDSFIKSSFDHLLNQF